MSDRDAGSEGPAILYGWHTVTMALANPERKIRKLLVTENAARRLTEENIDTRIQPEMVRPSQIDQRLGPDAVHQGLLAEADPLPSPDIEMLTPEGMVLVLDQITDPHNVGAIMRSAAAFAVKAIVTTARHSRLRRARIGAAGDGAKSRAGTWRLKRARFHDGRARQRRQRGFRCGRAARAAGAGFGRRRQGPAPVDTRDL